MIGVVEHGSWDGVAVVVPAGGTARRMGGTDKLAADLGGRSVLQALLDHVPAAVPVVLVGPPRPTSRPVLLTRERPPGAGPAAGVAAGLAALEAAARARVLRLPGAVAVLAGDAPWAAAAVPVLVAAVRAAGDGAPAAVATTGRRQPLLAVHRTAALRARVLGAGGDLAGRPASWLLEVPGVVEVPVAAAAVEDVDTPDDLERARRRAVGSLR